MNLCPAENLKLNGGGGMLLYQDDGQITFWNSGISCKFSNTLQKELNVLNVSSGMPWLSADFLRVDYSAKLDLDIVRPKITAGLMTLSDVEITSGRAKFLNDGADGFHVGSSFGFDIRKFEIAPSFMFAKVKFGDGDFYHFYGKPDIPKLIHLGLCAEYEKKHRAAITYENFDLDILNNSDTMLFHTNVYNMGINYRYTLPSSQRSWNFYGMLGFNYVKFSADGALTAANQQYALFPYAFYSVTGSPEAYAGWTLLSFDIQRKYAEHGLKIFAGNIFRGKANADAHYQYRKFFGDDEVNDNLAKINLPGTGGGFFAYSVETNDISITDEIRVRMGLQKVPIYFHGMDKFKIGEDTTKSTSKKSDWMSVTKTVLFSGLSGNFKVMF